jgi:hypothetical protein
MYFVFTYENRRMKPVEIVQEGERGEEGEQIGRDKCKIYCKHMCKYHNVSSYTNIICQ